MFSIAILNILLAVVTVYFLNTLLVYSLIVFVFNKMSKVFTDEQVTSFGFLSTISVLSLFLGFAALLLVAMEGLSRYQAGHSLLASVTVAMTFGMGVLLAALVFIAAFCKKK